MGRYRNFKLVLFCTAQNMLNLTEEALRRQLGFFNDYCGCDKVYLEPYRDGLTIEEEQLAMLIRVFKDCGVEVSGAITTTCNDLSPGDSEKYRMSGTYCYVNKTMREHLVKTVEYIARNFDEIIVDDWFFTSCTCDECREAKGDLSWEDFRTELLAEVGKNLIVGPAKAVNPNCKVIIKFPNWSESYQESGYNPDTQRAIFDLIYTGTETRNTPDSDQHLPRYLGYSLTRLMENYAPDRNGGCWFDPYGCSPIDIFLEQAYMSAFARPKELTLFCWGSLYKNRVIAPLGLQLDIIDRFLDQAGGCIGTPCYLPPKAQGEDHLEDFFGMAGVPLECVPEFPSEAKAVFLTLQAHKDPDIVAKLERFVACGGKAVVTSGFMLSALGKGIEQLTSIRYNGRRFRTNRFRDGGIIGMWESRSNNEMTFPLLEHRNNTTWTLAKAVLGEENYPIVLRDHYGKGQLVTIAVPDEYGYIYDMPAELLNVIREQFTDTVPFAVRGPGQASVFAYDNDTFAFYRYVDGGLTRGAFSIAVKGNADSIEDLSDLRTVIKPSQAFGSRGTIAMGGPQAPQTVFDIMAQPGDLTFFKINWSEDRYGNREEFKAVSAPHEFHAD